MGRHQFQAGFFRADESDIIGSLVETVAKYPAWAAAEIVRLRQYAAMLEFGVSPHEARETVWGHE